MDQSNATNPRPVATQRAGEGVIAWPRWRYISWAVALLLLISVGLKAEASFSRAAAESIPISRQIVDLAILAIEWGIAAWIVSGHAIVWARRAVLALFVVLLVVAGTHSFLGEQDCGCFGRIHVNPLVTTAIDAAAFIAIFWCMVRDRHSLARLSSHSGGATRPSVSAIATVAALLIPPATLVAAPYIATRAAGAANVSVLDPLSWIGRPFPLSTQLQPAREDLRHGRWIVVIANRNCHLCREFLSHTDSDALARADSPPAHPRNVALIDLAASSDHDSGPLNFSGGIPVPTLHVRDDQTYIADGPFEVFLENGKVEAVRRPPTADGQAP